MIIVILEHDFLAYYCGGRIRSQWLDGQPVAHIFLLMNGISRTTLKPLLYFVCVLFCSGDCSSRVVNTTLLPPTESQIPAPITVGVPTIQLKQPKGNQAQPEIWEAIQERFTLEVINFLNEGRFFNNARYQIGERGGTDFHVQINCENFEFRTRPGFLGVSLSIITLTIYPYAGGALGSVESDFSCQATLYDVAGREIRKFTKKQQNVFRLDLYVSYAAHLTAFFSEFFQEIARSAGAMNAPKD